MPAPYRLLRIRPRSSPHNETTGSIVDSSTIWNARTFRPYTYIYTLSKYTSPQPPEDQMVYCFFMLACCAVMSMTKPRAMCAANWIKPPNTRSLSFSTTSGSSALHNAHLANDASLPRNTTQQRHTTWAAFTANKQIFVVWNTLYKDIYAACTLPYTPTAGWPKASFLPELYAPLVLIPNRRYMYVLSLARCVYVGVYTCSIFHLYLPAVAYARDWKRIAGHLRHSNY